MPRLISEESDVVFEALPGEIMVGRGPLLKVNIMARYIAHNFKDGRGIWYRLWTRGCLETMLL